MKYFLCKKTMLLVSVGLLICFVGAWSKEGPKGPVRRILRKREVNENEEFLNAHNEMRRIVSPSATNMREMKWSEELATVAYNYASQCVFRHNSERSRQSATFNYVGENIYIGTYDSASFSVTLWDNEKHVYNFSSNTCTGVCGHYTQVVWSESEYVGCAKVLCGNYYLIVCNYGPGGNVNSLRPFTDGATCSQCPPNYTCNKGLCSISSWSIKHCVHSYVSLQILANLCINGYSEIFNKAQTLLHCNFEATLCLDNYDYNGVNFFRTTAFPGIRSTPEGNYFSMLASFSKTQHTAWFLSEELPDVSVRVEFNYTSTGDGELFFSYGQGEPVKWFTRFYTRGDNGIWKASSVEIPAGLKTFIYFTGRVGGTSGFGAVAVDNIRVKQI